MAAATALFVFVITTCRLSLTSACVALECLAPSTTQTTYTFGDINNWLVIFAIVVACIVGLLIVIMLIWLACWCCYRCDTERAPTIVKRVVVLRRRQQVQPVQQVQQKSLHLELVPPPPPPPPIIQRQPTEKIVVVQPVAVKPQSLMLTVSDSAHTASNPVVTTRIERPLTFTITPEFGNHQRDLSVYEVRPTNDFTAVPLGHYNHGCDECHHH